MKQTVNDVNINKGLSNQIFEFCRHFAGSQNIVAIAHVDNYSMKTIEEKKIVEIMLVIQNFQPRLMNYIKRVNEKTFLVFAVDQWVFERDIEMGFLGEAIASKLVLPHTPLFGDEYLLRKEIELKKRLIHELLENLIQSFPELAQRMQIKPQYFLYEAVLSRIRVFPLISYDASNLINGLIDNEAGFLASYNEALRQLGKEGEVYFFEDYIKISKRLSAQSQNPRIKLKNLSKSAPRTLFTSLLNTFPQLMNILSYNAEAFLKAQKINWRKRPEQPYLFIDPQKYVFFQTSAGLTSLSDRIDIKGFAQRMLLKDSEEIEIEPAGGMLNDVYVINARGNRTENRVIAKRFKDLSGFKWVPLTVWSLGARPFAITAQARLAKECAMNEFLRSEGFNVPKILHVSNTQRLIFMEFINGEDLSQIIKRISNATPQDNFNEELSRIEAAGTLIAQVHSHNVVLGDTKPENMIIRKDGSMYMIDFEQASQNSNGDKAWDIAVFLYYAGHYIYPIHGKGKAEVITKAFIHGYLKAGGDLKAIQKAGTPKYTRVFGIFTMWSIISAIANVCRKTELHSDTGI